MDSRLRRSTGRLCWKCQTNTRQMTQLKITRRKPMGMDKGMAWQTPEINKYETNLIVHVNRNSSLLEPAVLINFNGGEKMESNSRVGNVEYYCKMRWDRGGFIDGVSCGKIGWFLRSTMRMPTRTGEILIIVRRVRSGRESLMNEVISLISMGC